MNYGSKGQTKMTAGVDIGDKYSYLFVLHNDGGEVVEEGRLRTTPDDLRRRFDSARYRRMERRGLVVSHNRFLNGGSSGGIVGDIARRSRCLLAKWGKAIGAALIPLASACTVLIRAREHHQSPTGNCPCGFRNRGLNGLYTEYAGFLVQNTTDIQ
jgi:hypothetical protein